MSEQLRDVLIFIFEEGLDEDAFYRSNQYSDMSLDKLIKERLSFSSECLEATLLDLLIVNVQNKIGK